MSAQNPESLGAQLLAEMPQELAASVVFAREMPPRSGESSSWYLFACREFQEGIVNPIKDLHPREYETLLLMSSGLTYKEIAQAATIPKCTTTVRTQLHDIYGTLGVSSGDQAALFVPFDSRQFDTNTSIREDKGLLVMPELTQQEVAILECLRAGLSNKQIAHQLICSVSTVRTHTHHIHHKLGVKSLAPRIEAKRIIGAIETRNRFFGQVAMREEVSVITPRVNKILESIRTKIGSNSHKLADSKVSQLNGSILRDLQKLGFVPKDTLGTDKGWVDLNGLVASLLLRDRGTRHLLRNPDFLPLVKQSISLAVGHFLAETNNN